MILTIRIELGGEPQATTLLSRPQLLLSALASARCCQTAIPESVTPCFFRPTKTYLVLYLVINIALRVKRPTSLVAGGRLNALSLAAAGGSGLNIPPLQFWEG
jgi:hypothetical protein